MVFLNDLGLGGTEKAACRWAWGLADRGYDVAVLALADGPRRTELEERSIPVHLATATAREIASVLRALRPDVIHAHVPGRPHPGDVLGEALAGLAGRTPVVQTNVFGELRNPREDAWTDFRLFVSWTSCVQAARRVGLPLDEAFFRRASVAVNPVDPQEASHPDLIRGFRADLGVEPDSVLCGRLSRPDPRKWSDLTLDAFIQASKRHPSLKLLLREAPPEVVRRVRDSPSADRLIMLPMTSSTDELLLTMSALDLVIHTSRIGESFGYGIAEPMNLGRPVVSHSVPALDQAQLELVRHGVGGFIASTPRSMAQAIVRLASDVELRKRMGGAAQTHIRALASPDISLTRLEYALRRVVDGGDSESSATDVAHAREAARYLDEHQFGHTFGEWWSLQSQYRAARMRQSFHVWRRHVSFVR